MSTAYLDASVYIRQGEDVGGNMRTYTS